MSKDDKNGVKLQVIKENAKAIKSRINSKCLQTPLEFEFERTNTNRSNLFSLDLDFYSKPVFTNTWTYNQQRSRFIYAVIHSKSYYEKEGVKLGVSEIEIYQKFTQLTHSLGEIELFTHRTTFDSYLFDCYQKVLKDEQEERQSYLQTSLLNQLLMHNSTPDIIWKSIQRVTNGIKLVSSKLDNLYIQLKYRQVDPTAFGDLREPLDENLERLRSEQEYLTDDTSEWWRHKGIVSASFCIWRSKRRQCL